MSESKQTIPVDGQSVAAEQQSTATDEQAQTPGAVPPGEVLDAVEAADAVELQDDLDELGALAAKRDEYLALAQRTQADFENYRKRMAREVGVAEKRGTARLAKELLPALDSLGRALEHAGDDEHLAEGLTLVQKELLGALGRAGIESYSPEGEPFDPNAHEAMAQQPVEGAETGTIVEVYQQGFRHGETVLRPARVVVAA